MTVLTCDQLPVESLRTLLSRFGLALIFIEPQAPIPGSFWGESEAGLINHCLYVRPDTPVHSLLHEACHYICMDSQRRIYLHTDAGGNYLEENAVCYLQILLADCLPHVGKKRMWADMDAWGYTFRLGSSQTWFEQDAQDAQQWLRAYHLIDIDDQPTWQIRDK